VPASEADRVIDAFDGQSVKGREHRLERVGVR
jgi:hypothetical protein